VPYTRLEKIGSGGSSKVYKVLSPNYTIYALKRVSIKNACVAEIQGYKDEIQLLSRMDKHERIIHMFDYEITNSSITILMEIGEMDLKKVLEKNPYPGANYVRLWWEQVNFAATYSELRTYRNIDARSCSKHA